MTISGGTISNNSSYAVVNYSIASITGGTFSGQYAVSNGNTKDTTGNSADLTIEGGTFSGRTGGISTGYESTTQISGGTFTAVTGTCLVAYGDVTITNGSFTGGTNSTAYAVNASKNSSVTIEGGTFAIQDKATYTLYQSATTATITVSGGSFTGGTKGNIKKMARDDANPVTVSGGTFYSDVSAYVVEGNTAIEQEDGTYIIGADTATAVASVDGFGYTDLQEAINAADGKTVTLLQNVSGEQVTVLAGTTVTLDLAGKTLTSSGTTILNNGNLTIQDTIGNGGITSTNHVPVAAGSNSVTTIQSGTFTGVEEAVITGKSVGATINIEGGTFSASDNAVIAGNGTKREGDGNTINISGGTFNGGITTVGYIACGIYAPWKDTINVSGGTFNSGDSVISVLSEDTVSRVEVSGGTFSNAVPEEYCAEGFEPVKNSEGSYSVDKHELVQVEAKAATCTEASYEAYWTCSTCGKMYSDAAGTTEITAPVTISATGHSYGADWKSDETNH